MLYTFLVTGQIIIIKFVIDETSYLDIHECLLEIDDCHDDAICTDIIGSYTCQCKEGFTGDSSDCQGRGQADFLV